MKQAFYFIYILLLSLVGSTVKANCLSLEDYESTFQHKSIIQKTIKQGKLNLSFSTRITGLEECRTYLIVNNDKFDSYPSPKDADDICEDYTGKHEISLVKSINYNELTGLLGILVVNEYTASFASGGMHPYYGYHLYVYEKSGNHIYKQSSLDQVGWGGGVLIGNQIQKTVTMECEGKEAFKLLKSQEILKYLAQKVIVHKAYLYKTPNNSTQMYLIKDDKVTLLDEKTDDSDQKWYFINYKGKKNLNMWIKAEALDLAPKATEPKPTEKPIPKETSPQTKITTPEPVEIAKQELDTNPPKNAEVIKTEKAEPIKSANGSISLVFLSSMLGLLGWKFKNIL